MKRKINPAADKPTQTSAPKPMVIILMMWLVIVTILSIGFGMISAYTLAIHLRNGSEVGRVLKTGDDSTHYSFDRENQRACARVSPALLQDPGGCYSTQQEFIRGTFPLALSQLLQLLVLCFGLYGMWSCYQVDKFLLASALSFLTLVLWALSSLVSTLFST